MPFLVTTKRPRLNVAGGDAGRDVIPAFSSRQAVATLDEARSDVIVIVTNSPGALDTTTLHEYVAAIPESGGTVGPLPDGTVIEVERVNTFDLRVRTGQQHSGADPIAAFNAAQESS